MKEVLIDGVIGYSWWEDSGVTAKTVKKQLEGIEDGEEIKLIIDSPGGSVYEGIVIFNLIRDYAKTHPTSARVLCRAQSMASYIMLAPRTVDRSAKVTVMSNSIVLIHNPWTFALGDYRELRKEADYLEKLAALYGSVHSAISGKPEKEIRAAMDEESTYVGSEILDIGFANDLEDITQPETKEGEAPNGSAATINRDALVASARIELERTKEIARQAKAKDGASYQSDLEKAVALSVNVSIPPAPESAIESGKNNTGGLMNPDELKAQNRPLYDAIIALGEKAGIEKERARVNAHLLLGEKAGSLELAAKFIKAGASTIDESVNAEYWGAKMDNTHTEARNKDNVGDVHTAGQTGNAASAEEIAAAFLNGYKGRDVGGKPWDAE